MKRIVLLSFFLRSYYFLPAQRLGVEAKYIKENYPIEYENTLKKYAVFEWQDDFSMVVYEINRQSEALFSLISSFKSDNSNIVYKAIKEWSREGYKEQNVKVLSELKLFSLDGLLKIHCDWVMVEYEYTSQVKAKESF